jgi:hypothetical protein
MEKLREILLLAALPVLLLIYGCAPPPAEGPVSAGKPVQIRVTNRGTAPLGDVRINFVGTVVEFGTIAPGETTEYHAVEKSYSYARIDASVGGKPGRVQPIDFVGESLLPPGKYTWTLVGTPEAADDYARLTLDGTKRD